MENLYYVAEVREPDTCRVCGYVVKEAKSKTRVPGCPVFDAREIADLLWYGGVASDWKGPRRNPPEKA